MNPPIARRPRSESAHHRAERLARTYDGYLSKLELASRHEGPLPHLARFVLSEPKSSVYWAEVVTLAGGGLLVHGDVSTVLFGYYHRPKHWLQVLNWMGNYNYDYATEKAGIGGTKDAREFDEHVARFTILDQRRHDMIERAWARALWDLDIEYIGKHAFAERVYEITGDCELTTMGECTGSSVLMAQAMVRKLLALLGPHSDETGERHG